MKYNALFLGSFGTNHIRYAVVHLRGHVSFQGHGHNSLARLPCFADVNVLTLVGSLLGFVVWYFWWAIDQNTFPTTCFGFVSQGTEECFLLLRPEQNVEIEAAKPSASE